MSKKAFALSLLICLPASVYADNKKVAQPMGKTLKSEETLVVDLFKAIPESKEGQLLQKEMEAKQQRYAGILQKDQENLVKMNQEIEQKKSMLSADAISVKRDAFAREQRAYQTKAQEFEQEMRMFAQEGQQKMLQSFTEAAEELAKVTGKKAVQDRSGQYLYVADDVDSTVDLVKCLDTRYEIKLAQKQKEEATVLAEAKKATPGVAA